MKCGGVIDMDASPEGREIMEEYHKALEEVGPIKPDIDSGSSTPPLPKGNGMSVKEYLRQARTLQVGIRGKTLRIEQLRELVESTAVAFQDEPVQGGSSGDRLGNVVACICDLQAEIERDLKILVAMQRDIQYKINQVPEIKHRTMLELYYLTALSLERVAEVMSYSDRHIHRLHEEALHKIQPFMDSCHGMSPS